MRLANLPTSPALTPEAVAAAYEGLLARLPAPDAPAAAWLELFGAWEEVKRWVEGSLTRARFRESQDTRNEAASAATRAAREHVEPRLASYEARLRAAFLAAECRAGLATALPAQLFVRWQSALAAFEPANLPLRVKEGQLGADYMKLLGSAEVEVGGERLTAMAAIARLGEAGDRRGAWEAIVGWLEAHAAEFHHLFDQLVRLRHQMGLNLGDDSFIPLAYRCLDRVDYGPEDVKAFRLEIKQHVVPVLARLAAWQARELGTPTLAPWDTEYYPGLSLPGDPASIATQLERIQVLFDRLDPRLAAHVRRMTTRGLIDLPARPGKVPGAFCQALEDSQEAVILCNSTGSTKDIAVLIHELGHAMQIWESFAVPVIDLHAPGQEAAEVHSMGLEWLTLHTIDAVFEPEAARRYRRLMLVDLLKGLPYVAVVDAFQHWVYAHPEHGHAEREAAWDRLWREYMPSFQPTETRLAHRTRWMRQLHLFKHPFYYIDYALAQAGALQLWVMAEDDHAAAMASYLKLCSLGGTLPLVAFFEAGGLKSPFTPGLLGPLMERVAAELGL